MPTAKKTASSKTAAKKPSPAKSASSITKSTGPNHPSGKAYSPGASASVEREMHEFKEGKLKSGSGRTVTNPKQAIAIGLSEARKSGAKLPPPKKSAKKNSTSK